MKKDIEWLVKMINEEREILRQRFESGKGTPNETTFNEGRDWALAHVLRMINQLDKPEVLSLEWIEEHTYYEDEYDFYYADPDELKNLLVPKQGELETKIQELIESYKQEEDAYSNPENGWISGFIEDLKNLVEKEPLYYALIKGHELIAGEDACKYWKCDMRNGSMFLSNRYSHYGKYLAEMSKNDWGKFGINESNADFVKADEELN